MSRIARAGFTAAILFLAVTALFTPRHVTPSHRVPETAVAAPTPRAPVATPRDEANEPNTPSDDADAMIDLYGNDVSPSVATYSFDALGSLYEVHSPQTELPRLGSPKT